MREEEFEMSMNYENWLKSVPGEIAGDPLWKVEAYRLALFAADLGWRDVARHYFTETERTELNRLPGPEEIAQLLQDAPLP